MLQCQRKRGGYGTTEEEGGGGGGEECGVGWIFQSSAPHYYCLQYIMYKDDGGAD